MGNIQKDRDERVTNIENCDRYNYLFDRMSSGVVFCKAIYNQSGDMVDCIYKDMNAAYEKFTNLKKETTIGKKVSEMLPGTEPEWFSTFGNVVKTGKPISFEMFHENSSTHYSIYAYRSNEDEFAAIFEDISTRKKDEKIILESENRFKALSEAPFEAVFLSEKGICLDQNYSAEKMFAYTLSEAIGKPGIDWIAPQDRDKVIKNMLSGYEKPYEVLAMRKDGSTFYAEIQGKMMDTGGKTLRVTALNDITERKQAEAELQAMNQQLAAQNEEFQVLNEEMSKNMQHIQRINSELKKAKEKAEESNHLKTAFLNTMSHELRTPLNSVIGFSFLLNKNSPIEEITNYGKTINKSGNHLLNIVEDIFDLTMIESKEMLIQKETFNFAGFIDIIYTKIKAEQIKVEKDNIDIRFKPCKNYDKISMYSDSEKLEKIIFHLLKNALKFTSEGYIEYGFTEEIIDKKPMLKFYVKDTGIGISEDNKKLIFDIFRQLDDNSTRRYEGVGIGLSVAIKLIESLGGNMWVESDLGKGSQFYFTIPIEAEKKTLEEKPEDTAISKKENEIGNLKILVVEDEELINFYFKNVLKNENVLNAETGIKAIEVCKQNPDIDLILMDMKMPEMNGYDATRKIREFNKDVIIIAQTAYALAGDREKVIEAGCNDYIAKPINKKVLIETIKKYF
ncbi:MAG: response regulator [Bacteroidetes bacterium]|jgi:PAS domain S-box-containing protein|nr:response regulator [Bacteroidota bacterium]MBT6685053.1 response regulator [Bacteroidota bacterium]MBT7143192.1 response regulator [Bacteroidota bacterium]MBT7491014.1 response regulator [Bacteroidota bacterium]